MWHPPFRFRTTFRIRKTKDSLFEWRYRDTKKRASGIYWNYASIVSDKRLVSD